jgi:hypothetical protein
MKSDTDYQRFDGNTHIEAVSTNGGSMKVRNRYSSCHHQFLLFEKIKLNSELHSGDRFRCGRFLDSRRERMLPGRATHVRACTAAAGARAVRGRRVSGIGLFPENLRNIKPPTQTDTLNLWRELAGSIGEGRSSEIIAARIARQANTTTVDKTATDVLIQASSDQPKPSSAPAKAVASDSPQQCCSCQQGPSG